MQETYISRWHFYKCFDIQHAMKKYSVQVIYLICFQYYANDILLKRATSIRNEEI